MIAVLIVEIATLLCTLSEVEAAGGVAILEAQSATKTALSSTLSVCVLYNSKFQNLPSGVQKRNFHRLVDLSYTDGCTPQDFINSMSSLVNSGVAVMRGSCNFTHKARMVQEVRGAAVLVVDYVNSTQLVNPGGSASDFQTFNITLVTITHNDYMTVLNLSELVKVAVYAPLRPLWDPGRILIILLPTVLVVAGAAWSACDEFHYTRSALKTPKSHDQTDDNESNIATNNSQPEFSILVISIWFSLICGIILLLYFFYDYMVYFFITAFCILGSYSLYKCLHPLWSWIVPVTYLISTNKLPCIRSKVKLKDFLLLMPCFTIGIFWVIKRHAKYAWSIQDLLGAAFCVFFIHKLRLPNLKVIIVLQILLLVYDVFFVFVTPLFTSDGNSIMESVATGGRGHSKESLPLIFMLPNLSDSLWKKCLGRNFSILGFGDVIVPGLLVAYNAVFDVKTGNCMVYFISSSIGYFIGMIVCIICLVYTNSGQPALLYLVPGTLFITVVVAVIRQEFRNLYLGQHRPQPTTDDNIEPGNVDDLEDRDVNVNGGGEEQRNLIHLFFPYNYLIEKLPYQRTRLE